MRLVEIKKYILIITIVVLSLFLIGCGGSSGSTASTTETASPQTAAGESTIKPRNSVVPRPFTSNERTPVFFTDALKQKEPILIAFYNSEDSVSKEVLAEIKIVSDKYGQSAKFLILKPDDNEETSRLAEQLDVGFTPYISVLNRDGTIIFEKTGYIDSKVIEQAVYDAVNK